MIRELSALQGKPPNRVEAALKGLRVSQPDFATSIEVDTAPLVRSSTAWNRHMPSEHLEIDVTGELIGLRDGLAAQIQRKMDF